MLAPARFLHPPGREPDRVFHGEESIVVEAPRPSVWYTLLRFSAYPEWMDGVHEVRKTGDAVLHWRATVGGHELEWDADIVVMDDDALLEWHARGDGPSDVRISLDRAQGNFTRVTIADRVHPHGVRERLATAAGLCRHRRRRDLQSLKSQVEIETARIAA